MSNLDPQLNILWLSDIHYHKDYSDKDYHSNLKLYLDSFHSYLKGLDIDFDYILLSGDIAQNGEQADYDLFHNDVLNIIQVLHPHSNLLVIPGNHDVSRNGVGFYDDFINNNRSLDEFLLERKVDFLNIFKPFKEHFINNPKIPAVSSITYKENLLYGHILDKKNKTIIILLNSAWYSLGDIILEYYIKGELHKNKDSKSVIAAIKKITNEYGYQTLGLDVIDEIKEIINVLNDYPEYLTITTMHHPINWFTHKDQITKKEHNFHQIKIFTDLLLTGHEHISIEHPIEYINDGKILHIKAGCFLDFSKESKELEKKNNLNPFKINKNWFSTLEINTKKRTVKQGKHFFDNEISGWKLFPNTELLKLNKKHNVVISEKRLDDVFNDLITNKYDVIKYLFPNETIKIISDTVYYFKNSLVFFATSDDYCNFDNDSIKQYHHQYNFEKLYIVSVDLYNEISRKYLLENNRLLILNDIKSNYDFKFNFFRHNFFSSLSEKETPLYGNLVFVNKILPFWELEHLNC